MATFSKGILSGSTNGRPITVNNTTPSVATDGTAVHTAVTGTGGTMDEVWLWANNTSTENKQLFIHTIATAGSETGENYILPESGLQLIMPGLPFNNAARITMSATASGNILVYGYVNHIAT